MGNVNEKNASGDEEKDTRHILLNPKGHFDPWTDKTEARAIEAVLFPGVEPRYPPSPSPKAPARFKQGPPDVICLSTSTLLDNENRDFGEEFDIAQADIPSTSEPENEGKESGDTSLPLSDSIIPENFEAVEKAHPLPSAIGLDVSAPFVNEIRSLDTIEELNEDMALLNLENHIPEEPLPPSPLKRSHSLRAEYNSGTLGAAALQLLAPPDRATAITEQVLEKSPLALASNNPRVTLQQNIDIPIAPLPPSVVGEQEVTATVVPSPLILSPSALTNVDDVELKEPVDTHHQQEMEGKSKDDETPQLSRAPQKIHPDCQQGEKNSVAFPDSESSEDSPRIVPLAPLPETIPLPSLPIEENAALFVSEVLSFESSGLGLIVPNQAEIMEPDQLTIAASLIRPRLPDITSKCKEVEAPTQNRDVMVQAPSIMSQLGEVTHSVDNEPLEHSAGLQAPHLVTFQTHLSVGIQASTAEDEVELLQAAINTLKLDSPRIVAPPSPCLTAQHADLTAQSAREIVTPQTSPQNLISVIPEIRTYADATNIAIQHPELAKEVLRAPLASSQSSSTIDRFTRKIEAREGAEHTPDRPNWAKAPVQGDVTPTLSGWTPFNDAPQDSVHSPSIPNWAIAPVLESTSAPKSRRSQRERGRRRGKKAKKHQGKSDNVESPQSVSDPSTPLKSTPPAVPEPEKEVLNNVCKFTPTEEQRKVAANRQKVNKWITESASVMASPISNAERGSMGSASCSTLLMDSVSERVVTGGLGIDGDASFEKTPLSPQSRMAKTLDVREALKRGLNDQVSVEDDQRTKTKPSDPAPTTTAEKSVEDYSLFQDDLVDKGKNPMARSPSPVSRSRSASIASSLASGISAKSGVSTSSRLFQRAIQEVGFCSRPISDTQYGAIRQILPEGQDKEPPNAVAQSPEPLSRKSPQIDNTTPIAISAVTCPETMVTQEATEGAAPDTKGKVKNAAPLHHMVEARRGAGSHDKRFVFSFTPPQASIGKEAQKAPAGSQQAITPFATQMGSNAVPRFGQGEKTPRVLSSRTFIPRGKYVPPPIRDGAHQGQASTTSPAALATGIDTPTSQAQKTSQTSQLPKNGIIATAAARGLNVHAPSFDLPDDAFVTNNFQRPVPGRSNVMPDVSAHFGTASGPLASVQRDPRGRPTVSGHHPQPSSNPPIVSHTTDAHTNPATRFQDHDTMTPLGFPGVNQAQPQRFFDPQVQAQAPNPQSELAEYMANLAMAQERLQQNMVDFVHLASSYGKPETFNPTVTAGRFQNSNFRGQGSRTSFGPVTIDETRTFLQSPVCPQGSSSFTSPRASLPSHFQPQTSAQYATHNMFEEYCRRQRQETRTMHENIPSRLPRRKI